MLHQTIATLSGILGPEIDLSKSRVETLCLIVVGMISARTVNLTHLACDRPTVAQPASTYRRLQRFFQHVLRPDQDLGDAAACPALGPERIVAART